MNDQEKVSISRKFYINFHICELYLLSTCMTIDKLHIFLKITEKWTAMEINSALKSAGKRL